MPKDAPMALCHASNKFVGAMSEARGVLTMACAMQHLDADPFEDLQSAENVFNVLVEALKEAVEAADDFRDDVIAVIERDAPALANTMKGGV